MTDNPSKMKRFSFIQQFFEGKIPEVSVWALEEEVLNEFATLEKAMWALEYFNQISWKYLPWISYRKDENLFCSESFDISLLYICDDIFFLIILWHWVESKTGRPW